MSRGSSPFSTSYAEQVAEQASEIFVPRVGKEAARVGQHADEARRSRPRLESAFICHVMPSS